MNPQSPQKTSFVSDALDQFESAWSDDTQGPVEIEAFLPPPAHEYYVPILIALVQSDLWHRWKPKHSATPAGDQRTVVFPPKLEDYFERFPRLAEARVDFIRTLIRKEYKVRHKFGDKPSTSEYRTRFPLWPVSDADFAKELDQLHKETPAPASPLGKLPTIPGFKITEQLGEGGMGVVYKATQDRLGRTVALKMILSGMSSSGELARFKIEANALARLENPNIVRVFELGDHEGRPYLVMEYVGGGTLATRIKGKRLAVRDAARLTFVLAQSVHHAHQKKIVHRDLKPANILMTPDQQPKISDFGLAKLLDANTRLTRTGCPLGTPPYMAPEQVEGHGNEKTDVYALGAILYEMLTGQPPYLGKTADVVLKQVKSEQCQPIPPRKKNAKVQLDLETICLKCLEKAPADRYASAQDLADDLDRYLNDLNIHARPPSPVTHVRRWVKRNRLVAAGAAGLFFALLALILGTSTWLLLGQTSILESDLAKGQQQQVQTKHDLQEEETKRKQAQQERELANRKLGEEEANRRLAELNTLRARLEQTHSDAETLLEQVSARKGSQSAALATIAKAQDLRAEGQKILAALGPTADEAGFAGRWEKRQVALRDQATWWLARFHLQASKSMRLPDLEPRQNFAAAVDEQGSRVVVVYGGAADARLIDPRTLEATSLRLPSFAVPSIEPKMAPPRIALSADGSQLVLGQIGHNALAIIQVPSGALAAELPLPAKVTMRLAGPLRFVGNDRIELKGLAAPHVVWEKRDGAWKITETTPAKIPVRLEEIVVATGKDYEAASDGLGHRSVFLRPRAGNAPGTQVWFTGQEEFGGVAKKPGTVKLPGFPKKGTELFNQAAFAPGSDLLYLLTTHQMLAIDAVTGKRLAVRLDGPGPSGPLKQLLPYAGGAITLEPQWSEDVPELEKFGTFPPPKNGPAPIKLTVWLTAVSRLDSRPMVHESAVRIIATAPDGLVLTGGDDRQVRAWNKKTALTFSPGVSFGAAPLPGREPRDKTWTSALYPTWEFAGVNKQRLLIERAEILANPAFGFGKPPTIRTDVFDASTGQALHTFPADGPGRLLRLDGQPGQIDVNGMPLRSATGSVRSADGRFAVVVARDDARSVDLELWSLQTCKSVGKLARIDKDFNIRFPGARWATAFFSPTGRWALVGRNTGQSSGLGTDGAWDYDLWQTEPFQHTAKIRVPAPLMRCEFDADEKKAVLVCGTQFAGVSSVQLVNLGASPAALELFPRNHHGPLESLVLSDQHVLIHLRPVEMLRGTGGSFLFARAKGKRVVLGEEKWKSGPNAILSPDGKRLLRYGVRDDKSEPGKLDTEMWDLPTLTMVNKASITGQLLITPTPGRFKGVGADREKIVFRRVAGLDKSTEQFIALSWSDGAEINAPATLVEVEALDRPWSLWSYVDGLALIHANRAKPVRLDESSGRHAQAIFAPAQDRLCLLPGPFDAGKSFRGGVWDTTTGKRLLDIPATSHFLGFDALGKRALTMDAKTTVVTVHDLDARKDTAHKLPAPIDAMSQEPGLRIEKFAALLNAEGTMLVAPMQGLLQMWDLRNERGAGSVDRPGHTAAISALAQHQGAGLIVSGSEDGVINLWQRPDGKPLRSLLACKGTITGLAFSSTGARVYASATDGSAVCTQTLDGAVVWRYPAESSRPPISCLVLAPDGKRLALGLQNGNVVLLDAETGNGTATISIGPVSVQSLAFNPTGDMLVAGGEDGQVRFYAVTNQLKPGSIWKVGAPVQTVCFTPGGRHLLVGADNLQLWSVPAGKRVWQIEPPNGTVRSIALHNSQDLLVLDGTGQVSVLPLRDWLARLQEIGLGLDGVLEE